MSRRKRVLLWTGRLIVLVVVGLVAVEMLIALRPTEKERKLAQIKVGMTQAEAMRILRDTLDTLVDDPAGADWSATICYSGFTGIRIRFRDGVVADVSFMRGPRGFFHSLLWWYGFLPGWLK
jgi:hypothetical protein